MIGRACALGGGVVGRAGGVLTLCGSRSGERPNEAWVLLLSWCHGANVAAPQCTQLHQCEGAEGARAGESVIGRVRGGGTRPAAAWRAAWARGAGRGAAAAERSRAFVVVSLVLQWFIYWYR